MHARANPGDAGLDLHAAEPATLQPAGGRAAVGTGLAVEIPPGHGALVLPRSGLAARHGIGLANAPGLIDPGYRGEIRVLLANNDPHEPFEVRPGDLGLVARKVEQLGPRRPHVPVSRTLRIPVPHRPRASRRRARLCAGRGLGRVRRTQTVY